MMRVNYKKIVFAAVIGLFVSNVFAASAVERPTDSTRLGQLHVKANVILEPYLLAQGSIATYDWPYYVSGISTTNKRCGNGTYPELTTSLQTTYSNDFYAIGGITNTLKLYNYRLYGELHLDNRGAVGGNTRSPATASWQIWCKPLRSA